MNNNLREKYVASLLCPYIACKSKGQRYMIHNATHDLVYRSYLLYEELKSGKLDKDSLTYTIEAFYEYNTKFDKEEVNENI